MQHLCIAHINEQEEEQTLKEHSFGVAEYTRKTCQPMRLSAMGYLAGLLHDMGKATKKFDQYIRDAHSGKSVQRGSVNHTFAGVIYIWERYHESDDIFQMLTAELIAYAIGAHHGLFDCIGMERPGKGDFIYRLEKDKTELCYEEALENYFSQVVTQEQIDLLFQEAVQEVKKHAEICCDAFYRGMLTRLLTSALIDGDRKDTAAFMTENAQVPFEIDQEFWLRNLTFCENKIAEFAQNSDVQKARAYISEACRRKAEAPPGIYQLHVPTGGGKTISVHRYALAHAQIYKKKRIIYLIPLLSILDQNSKVIRNYMLDQDAVAEHHSNVVLLDEKAEQINQYEFIAETWNTPVMISTMVQFLNILFSGKTTAVRRMQALCDSVIVLDEIQSLPWRITNMLMKALNFLQTVCNCTIILSSATQPCFDKLHVKLELAEQPELVLAHKTLYQAFARTNMIDQTKPGGYQAEEIAMFAASLLGDANSVLIICNTKKDVQNLYRLLREQGYATYHLSTGMCMAHRMDVIAELNRMLKQNQETDEKQKFICVSTQLVEAGVDFSFERVIRLIAGMDNIVQSAGRENRSFEYGMICPFYIMNLQKENLSHLPEIETRQHATLQLLHAFQKFPERYDRDLASEKSISTYYECLFTELEQKGTLSYITKIDGVRRSLFDMLNCDVDDQRGIILTQPFQTVGETFTVFDTASTDIVVPYGEEGRLLVADLLGERIQYDVVFLHRSVKKAAQYSISLFEYQIKALGNQLIRRRLGDKTIYILHESCYDSAIDGIGFQEDGEMETLIF